ncbi:putative nucleotidyltransferase [Phycisphaera mikurensis]|nr:putative nucleotidyltransferase [Phycisphaera mikurensis]
MLTLADACSCPVGGIAVANRTAIRFTRDVDLAIAVADDAEAEAVARCFLSGGYALRGSLKQTAVDRLSTLRLRPPTPRDGQVDEGLVPMVDVLFASSGIEAECVDAATPVRVAPGLAVPTASVPHLIALKLLSESERRLQDRIDLLMLIRVATASDLETVQNLLRLIRTRRFHRDKDLPARLAHFCELAASDDPGGTLG